MGRKPGRGLRSGACAALIVSLACAAAPAAPGGELAPARDLAREARAAAAARTPLVVLYTQPGCAWCERVRRDHLAPLAAQGAVRVVEVDITSDAPLAGFGAGPQTHAAFARGQGVRVTPTLAFLGARGEALAEPLVGFTSADFYPSYLERRLDKARAALRAPAL